MNHDPNFGEIFDPWLTICQKHVRHYNMFMDACIPNTGLVMVAQKDSPPPLYHGSGASR